MKTDTITRFGAIFIDYENLFYSLHNKYSEPPEVNNYSTEIIRNLKRQFEEKQGTSLIVMNAYADFEKIPGGSQGSLYLMGISTTNVLGSQHKNAADMQMCIDLMHTLYTRKDIENYLIVAGDRDYIPVVRHLRRQGKEIFMASFRESASGDLLEIVGNQFFIDIAPMLSAESQKALEDHKTEVFYRPVSTGHAKPVVIKPMGKIDLDAISKPKPTKPANAEPPPNPPRPKMQMTEEDKEEQFIDAVLNYIEDTGYKEPGLVPLFRYLTDEMPLLANWERKSILEKLQMKNVVRVESKEIPGYDYPVSMLIINYEDKLVKRLLEMD